MYQQHRPRMAFNQSHRMQHSMQHHNFRGKSPRFGHKQKYHGLPFSQSSNEDNWCDTCDRGFPTFDMLEEHKQQHQKCNIDGCQVVAHPKMITKHIQMQHSTGLFKKIANLQNPEDIQKWREERKKNYPTKKNVDKKIAEMKAKIERGEKIGLKKDKRNKNGEIQKRKHIYSTENVENKRKKSSNSDNTNVNNNKTQKKKHKKEDTLTPSENVRKLKPFPGILELIMDSNAEENENENCVTEANLDYQIEDDDDDCLHKVKEMDTDSKTEEPLVCGALSTLMCDYGSSDEENGAQNLINETERSKDNSYLKNEDHKSDKTKNTTPHASNSSNNGTQATKIEISNPVKKHESVSDDDSPPEELKVEKPDAIEGDKNEKNVNTTNNKAKKNKKKDFRSDRVNKKPKPKLPSTLLQKLLHREIQQERNIVLQCIRHIVKNNYFDK